MSNTLVRCLCLTIWFVLLEGEVYEDRPKIKTTNGHLVLLPAVDKNIYLMPNGPKSNIFIGDLNLLTINTTSINDERYQPPADEDMDKYLNSPNGVLRRLDRLEAQNSVLSAELQSNFTYFRQRLNRLQTRIMRVQSQINNRHDGCQLHPCENGGTCLNLVNGYHCLCPSNWESRNCDVDVNECRKFAGTDLGCQNGALCMNKPGSYECLCKSGWYGLHCTRKAKDCSGGDFEMCGHGTCISVTTGEGVKCICNQGWTTNGTGVACLTDVNECESNQGPRCSVNPKVNCINLPGSFICGQCPAGYEGDGYICSDIDECTTTVNGGCSTSPMVQCYNTIGSRICGPCPQGYQGDGTSCTWRGSCNINRGGCHPSAQCIETPGFGGGQMAQCICPSGMDGDGIGLHGCYISTNNSTQHCGLANPCGPNGQCHPLRSGYTCICSKGYGGALCDTLVNYCANNPCRNGGSCHIDDTFARGFRCECTAQYSGELCQVHAKTCGGVLDSEEGSIVYPLLNSTYSHNSRCAWVIHTDPSKVINVTFSKFDLEEDPECLYDFLQIHDGRSAASQYIGRFCGNIFPNGGNIISSHNNLYFWFRSDPSVAKNGFALHWTSIAPICGGEVDATIHGHISSPGSPGKYPPNRDCYWHLTTVFGKRIQLHFYELDIETHPNCSFDHLSIYDGARNTDPLLNRFCNSTQPAPLESAGSEILVHFHSDAYGSGKGFQITYAPIEGIPGCGGYFTAERGEISSPSFNNKYLNNLLCEYKIKTSAGTKIRIKFMSFRLERSFKCKYDHLKIYDGSSSEAPLVGRFCGNSYPKEYTTTSNTIFMKFQSDHSVASDGFRISYEAVCHQEILGDSGVIKSPGYPFSYPENRLCEYIIHATPGKAIQLTFQDFDIEDNSLNNCRYDHVEIRDGPDINSTVLGKYCGGVDHMPPVQTSTFNFMYLRFNSDMSISGTGFYANYTTIDTECGGIHRETTGIIYHPSSANSDTEYQNNQVCTWILIAPLGMHIKLTWNRFDLEEMPSCRSDYLELTEIDDNNNNNILGKFCGTTAPPALTTSTNRLMMKFSSDSSVRSTGFSISYSFLDESTHCGGTFFKTSGYIHSPGWPNMYKPNRDCKWTITVPNGQQIMLNFTDFGLEGRDDKCYADFLDIRNGASRNSPSIGKFCGPRKPQRILSFGNSLFLHFHSDHYISGKGFNIKWDGTIAGCGGTLTSERGSVSSPNYPSNYNANAECFYKIVVSFGSRIQINFRELDLERTLNCNGDYVEIFDGRDENAPSLGKYCHMLPKLNDIQTTSNYAFIKFRSDFFIGGKGFLLNYYTLCNNNLTGSYGAIESPGYPNQYPTYSKCLWTITVAKGSRINVTFTHFDLLKTETRYWRYTPFRPIHELISKPWNRDTPMCNNDYLQTKETSHSTYSEKNCGQSLPPMITTDSNSFQIKFVSDSAHSNTGFHLEWVRYGCGGHIQKQSGYISLDKKTTDAKEEVECEWLIESRQGTSISFSITDLYMMDSKNCTKDAIEIYNGQNVHSPLLTKICHRGASSVRSSSNFMLVRFRTKSNLKNIYFESHFDAYGEICGGRIEARSGMIYSKNYPQNYDNNLNCIYYIVVPYGHRIEINFIDIDLYSTKDEFTDDESCNDSITIYDSDNISDKNYTHRICPNIKSKSILSKNNKLTLQFISDGYGNAKGFKANFTMTCGAIITATYSGVISNDKFINHASHNCSWTILAPKLDQKITLTILHMSLSRNLDLNTNRRCPSTFLRVFNGDDENAPLIDEYCGRKAPPMIVSRGNVLTVQLGTYTNSISGQFSAHYSPLSTACGGELSSEEGSIASPNYPLSYPSGSNCEWILNTSPGNQVYVTFEKFSLDYSEGCNEDYLEIREDNGAGRLLGVYCGDTIPTNTTVASKMYIKFYSDNNNSGRGFLIHYGFLHGNDITGLDRGQIASPLYPYMYTGSAEYTWRITSPGRERLNLIIDQLEIQVRGFLCYNYLALYDGYDEQAPLIKRFCGILDSKQEELQTSSNIVYIKLVLDDYNTGSIFHIKWAKDNRIIDNDDEVKINCGLKETHVILPGTSETFSSPNYPEEYDNNLNCEWIFMSTPGHYLSLLFSDINVEETSGCFADSISIDSSDNGMDWQSIKMNLCVSTDFTEAMNSSLYFRIKFKTDSSVTRKGFKAKVRTISGGVILSSSSTVGLTWLDWVTSSYKEKRRYTWTVKVRLGRVIKLHFEHFNITNLHDECTSFVYLRNGNSADSPLLGSGKYCGYSHENKSELITSSNSFFVSFNNIRPSMQFQNFIIRYEENDIQCGVRSLLDAEHSWEIINSPNYPSVPAPFSECTWIFTGPPGEILRIDFIDRFDLEDKIDCTTEFVEIHDGASSLSPLKGRYCSYRPGTIKTSNNVVYVKYSTQLSEPRNGFKANVSIDICGGTITDGIGEVTSPGYPHMQLLPYGSICQWKIIGIPQHVFKIKLEDIDLPESQVPCATKVTIEESIAVNNSIAILKTMCHEDIANTLPVVETSSNEVIIKLHIGIPSEYNQMSNRGFRFTFNTSRPLCGGVVTTSEGYLMTPGYPRETTLRYCQWLITVPNKSRRVRLELLDIDLGVKKQRIGMYNDLKFQSLMQVLSDDNLSPGDNIYESSGNKMAIYVWLSPLSTGHRFKAKFTSDSESLCGGSLSGNYIELNSPPLQRSYTCEWYYNNEQDLMNNNTGYGSSVVVNAKVNTSASFVLASPKTRCRYTEPKLRIESTLIEGSLIFSREFCGNIEEYFRIPTTVMNLRATHSKNTTLDFHLNWKVQPCGGVRHVGEGSNNIINVPSVYNESLDCAWLLKVPIGNRVELKLEGSFQLACEDEFIRISASLAENSPWIGDYCKDKLQDNPLTVPYRHIFVQYHSKTKSKTNIRLMVKTVNNQCGRILNRNEQNIFSSPNYPKHYYENQECTWEINSDLGSRISLQFVDRFVIEDRPNCTKDVVIIYDWKENVYTEMARLCGRQIPPTYNSTYNRMKVVLRTDADINLDGFRAKWVPICGGTFKATEKEQFLYSPGYPNEYLPFLDCIYNITAPAERVIITFHDFELEGSYPDCNYDNLTITANNENDYLFAEYCGSKAPPSVNNYDLVTIRFKTDRFIQRKGFKLSYKIYSCGGKVTKISTLSTGPFDNYANNMNCTWVIEAPSNQNVVLKFLFIDIEGNNECYNDYIAVYNNDNVDYDKRLALLCGHINSTTVLRSTGNAMVLQFITDSSLTFKGFKAEVTFSYSELVGCGGHIDLTTQSTHLLKSPKINNNILYENFLDCQWTIKAAVDNYIKIEFISFHISSCRDVNQTAVGFSKCDCDLVEIKDGLNPNSLTMGTYCGHTIPPPLTSSGNLISVRLSTDGEINSSGFEARLSQHQSSCGQSLFTVTNEVQRLRSPGYEEGSIPRGIHCSYHLQSSAKYSTVRLSVRYLDIRTPSTESNQCDKDKLLIKSSPSPHNVTVGKDLVINHEPDSFFEHYYYYVDTIQFPNQIELCGIKHSVDYYIHGSSTINLLTSPESDSLTHKGMEIEFDYPGFCGRNYTEPQGRIQSTYGGETQNKVVDCFTLITAPQNYTISLYFISVYPDYWNSAVKLEVIDGNKLTDPKILTVTNEADENYALFSTGRYILIKNHMENTQLTFDLNYLTTDKGRGCGGRLFNVIGKITSPLYPEIYRKKSTCEWELETPHTTRLHLHFSVFDLGISCDRNYVQLIDRKGNTIATYCSETPADYKSEDNYVKIVFKTNMNNGGTGWVASFTGFI